MAKKTRVLQSAFVERRAPSWERLDVLLARAGRRGLRGLAPDEVSELGRLYRWTTSDLAFAVGRGYSDGLIEYLNRLVARAHAYVYGGSAQTGWRRIGRFYTQTFPCQFRRSFSFFAIVSLLMMACAIVGYVVCRNHPSDAYALLPHDLIPPSIKKSLHDSNFAVGFTDAPAMASEIIANNVKVAFIEFAGAVTLGLTTTYITVLNGLMLGGVAALFTNAGFGSDFWVTVAPHGFIELTAFNIAGASAFLITAGILYPGRLRRRDAIRLNAQRAGVLIAGVASMLLVAGTIEGYFSPRRIPDSTRLGFGLLTGLLLILYFGFAGRKQSQEER